MLEKKELNKSEFISLEENTINDKITKNEEQKNKLSTGLRKFLWLAPMAIFAGAADISSIANGYNANKYQVAVGVFLVAYGIDLLSKYFFNKSQIKNLGEEIDNLKQSLEDLPQKVEEIFDNNTDKINIIENKCGVTYKKMKI